MRHPARRLTLIGTFAVVAMLFSAGMVIGDPSALWNIVHGKCVSHMSEGAGPRPCAAVEPPQPGRAGYALLKDIRGVAQYLLIPTRRVSGIEDKQVLEPDVDALWQAGWQARPFVARALGRDLPEADYGMAINSAGARSQNQLHIHLDCLAPEVLAARPALEALGPTWADVNAPLPGGPYRGVKVSGDLAQIAPFRRLADALPHVEDMEHESLGIIAGGMGGADEKTPSFILLATSAGGHGHAEALLDHACGALLGRN